MAKVIDLTKSDGDLVVLGRSIVVPSSDFDAQPTPLDGSLRYNPTLGKMQFFHNDAWNTLGDNSTSTSTITVSNDHTHAMSSILGLQTALGNKAALIHGHSIADISGLAEELTNRALLVHTHTVAGVTGLQGLLDGKSAITHTHTLNAKEKISACLPNNPPANLKLVWVAAENVVLPSGLPNSRFSTLIAPASNFQITLFRNGTQNIGNIVFTPLGDVIITFTNSVTLLAGDTLTFSLPARDTALNTLSFTLLADIPAQTIG